VKQFLSTYFTLIKQNLSVKQFATVFFFELIGSCFSIVAIFLLGFVIQVMTLGDIATHKVFISLSFNIPVWVIVLSVIILNIALLCASAASYFYSAKLCRKFTRFAYTNSLDRNINGFANSTIDELDINDKELDSFRSFFTTDAHLSFMSMEAMLRAIRPISLLVVFLVPLVILEAKVLYFVIVLVFISSPFLLKINRDTASSAQSVFGVERKKVYAEIISAVKELDKSLTSSFVGNEKVYDEMKMERMLDSFDYWKLSSDKVTYVMTIVKSLGLQLAIIVLIGSLYYYEDIPLSTVAILGMGLLKIQEAFLGVFSRLTVLSRLYPIVKRYRNFEQKFGLALLKQNKKKEDYSNNSLLTSGKSILISMPPNFRKSEVSMLNEQLSLYNPNYDIRSLALGEYVEIFSDKPIDGADLGKLLKEYIARGYSDNEIFIALKEQVGFDVASAEVMADIGTLVSNVWESLNLQSRLFIYLLVFQMDETIQYLKCPINQIEVVKLVAGEAFADNFKPIVVFSNNVEESKKGYFDIVLGSAETNNEDNPELNDVEF